MKIQSQVYVLVALGVVSTDAWFWPWTGTTTLAPTPAVEPEGSGSPAGSGDPPPESFAKLGAEIIDEGHGFQNVVQTWNETTVAPVLTTTIQIQNENGSEAAGNSSPIKPGNGTMLFKGFGSGTSNVSKLKPEFEPGLDSDNKSHLWSRLRSESGFGSRSETSWESGIETVVSSIKKQKKGLVSDDYRGSDNRSSVMSQEGEIKLKSQSNHRVTHTDNNSSSTERDTTSNNTQKNGKPNTTSTWKTVGFNLTFLQENSSRGDALLAIKSNNSGEPTRIIQSNQAVDISQIAGGELATKQEVSHNKLLQSSLVVGQMLYTNQTLPSTPKTIISYLQTDHEKNDVSSVARVYPPALGQPSATTSPDDHIQTPAKTLNQTAEGSVERGESPKCLLLDTALPFCSMTGEQFLVPNYLNHTNVAEVQVLFHNWAWLLESRCHHSLEWFFCLLLVPKCGSLVPLLPCRSVCEVLKDSCWTLLDEGRLPVACHALPDEDDGYQCLSVSNQKGKHWLKGILIMAFIFNQFSNLSSPICFITHFPLINPPSCPASALHSINKVLVPTLKQPIY